MHRLVVAICRVSRRAGSRRWLWPVILMSAVLAGCGASSGLGGSPSAGPSARPGPDLSARVAASDLPVPARVASAFADWFAERYVGEDRPPTSSRVSAFRRSIAVSCVRVVDGQYPCTVSLRHPSVPSARSGFPLACVAFVAADGAITAGRCAAGPGLPAPVTRPGYVDCAKVGRVVSISDPRGDTAVSEQGKPDGAAHAPWADLTEVRLAASPSALCIDFATVAPPRPGTRLIVLAVNKHAREPQLETIDPDVDFTAPAPQIELSPNSPISGELGQSGRWTSWFATTSDIGPVSSAFLRAPFQFRAGTEFEQSTSGGLLVVTDSAPPSPRLISYP
jgi:hypothetical protein